MLILYIVLVCIAVVSLMYAGETRAITAPAKDSGMASAIGGLALVGISVLGVMACKEETASMPPPRPSLSAYEVSDAGVDDTAFDAMAESDEPDEVCDARDNDCGDTPITYDGCYVIIHYKDGDVRLPNFSGCSNPYPLSFKQGLNEFIRQSERGASSP